MPVKRFLALDGFRGICAIVVVVYHTHVLGTFTEWIFFRNGSLFVDFFFILSGFVLCHSYGQRLFNKTVFKQFLISRTFRLFPLHLFMLLVFILFETGKSVAQSKGYNFTTPSFSGVNDESEIFFNLFLLQSWLSNASIYSFNYPSWSISVEYYTYIILGLILFIVPAFRTTIFFIIVALTFFLMFNGSHLLKDEAVGGLFCFFSGCLCYLLYLRIKDALLSKTSYNFLEIISLSALVLIFEMNIDHKNIVVSFLFMIIILIFSFEGGIISAILKSKPVGYLGKLSYSIYLTHASILFLVLSGVMILSKVTGRNLTPVMGIGNDVSMRYITTGNVIINNLLVFSIVGVVLLVAKFSYKLIELNGISLGKKVSKSLIKS
ncbi:acyltransferase family protein [Mucilaginibacter calamicampi]|uniref:Acyltransferase family protein n=1 Tax=Mucilaginibacter calamicampi TaxID=1302352 RepID=A0ABW2Z0E1_9SPHI